MIIATPFAVPEGWSNPEDVDTLYALGVFAGIPTLLFVLIALLVYLPDMARQRIVPQPGAATEWFGGKRSTADLAEPDTDESQAGGASGRW